jgi:hypothetical protein
MLAATLLAIFLIPVTFDVVERLSHRLRRKGRNPQAAPEPGGDEQPA